MNIFTLAGNYFEMQNCHTEVVSGLSSFSFSYPDGLLHQSALQSSFYVKYDNPSCPQLSHLKRTMDLNTQSTAKTSPCESPCCLHHAKRAEKAAIVHLFIVMPSKWSSNFLVFISGFVYIGVA